MHLTTDDSYDPFAAGQYSVQWSATAATVTYVYDYMHLDTGVTVNVPLNTNEECT